VGRRLGLADVSAPEQRLRSDALRGRAGGGFGAAFDLASRFCCGVCAVGGLFKIRIWGRRRRLYTPPVRHDRGVNDERALVPLDSDVRGDHFSSRD